MQANHPTVVLRSLLNTLQPKIYDLFRLVLLCKCLTETWELLYIVLLVGEPVDPQLTNCRVPSVWYVCFEAATVFGPYVVERCLGCIVFRCRVASKKRNEIRLGENGSQEERF